MLYLFIYARALTKLDTITKHEVVYLDKNGNKNVNF